MLGFWSGYRSSILLTLNPSISYYLFESFKSRFPPNSITIGGNGKARKTHSSLETFLYAAVSKSIASTFTYPFILAKTRMQVSERRDLTPLRVLARIIKEEGYQVTPPLLPQLMQGLFEGLLGQIIKGFWAQGFTLMFKERVGQMIIYLYLKLHQYRAQGGNMHTLMEEGKAQAAQMAQQAGEKLPEGVNVTTAKEMLVNTAEGARDAVMNPGQTAGAVVDSVSDKMVDVAGYARDALRGTSGEDVKEVIKDAVETAKGEVKGAVEQAKKK
jgi:Mitochondrial carrier protein